MNNNKIYYSKNAILFRLIVTSIFGSIILIFLSIRLFFQDSPNDDAFYFFFFIVLLGLLTMIYFVIRFLLLLKNKLPAIIVEYDKLIFCKLDMFFRFKIIRISHNSILNMSTDYDYDKELGQTGKRLSLKLKDSEKDFVFSLVFINETHLDIYDKIKRINPDCKILNIGTFEYE